MNSDLRNPSSACRSRCGRVRKADQPTSSAEFTLFWAAGDIDGALPFIAEHSVYALYISGDLLPFAGETVGRDNITVALRRMRADYEYLLYRPLDLIEQRGRGAVPGRVHVPAPRAAARFSAGASA